MKTVHNSKFLRRLLIDYSDIQENLEYEVEKRCHYNYKNKRKGRLRSEIASSDSYQRSMGWLMAIQHVIWFGWKWSGNTERDEYMFWKTLEHIKVNT